MSVYLPEKLACFQMTMVLVNVMSEVIMMLINDFWNLTYMV